ncbi:sensor histidine kinase [Arthrobacter sp. JZ12]|uniref:sensor histidine kinase n=1 Tax=Arthrobacter sp. JZ12 TaxID=2654190 RepID=UPI002B4596E2|nr:sensor histidine kinase [Arthrobacter sp. JZ12]WRH26254.1 sensor histidine kinase [Arthrobacter sp. JZ12]
MTLQLHGKAAVLRWMHAGFYLLLLTSAVRYLLSHGLDEQWVLLLALSLLLTCVYAGGSMLLAQGRYAGAWLMAVLVLWGLLAFMAPSFVWCAFPLFFACRHLLRGWQASVCLIVVVLVMVAALARLTGGPDVALIVGPVAVAALMLAVYNRIEQESLARQKLVDELTAAQAELSTSKQREGALAERERLAREIHDTVTQDLTQSVLLLEAADQLWDAEPASSRAHVTQATRSVRRSLVEARNLVHNLTSPQLDHRSLTDALRAATADIPGLHLNVTGVEYPLSPEINHALLRIAQSAAANVRLHAGARSAVLTLSYLSDGVSLDLFDDGRGFDPAAAETHGYGLRAMRQRAEQLGGTFTVESQPGDGTVVTAWLPLQEGA